MSAVQPGASTPKASSRPWKAAKSVSDIAVGVFFRTVFGTLALVDYAASTWALRDSSRLPFLASYCQFKGQAPFITPFIMCVVLLLPLILVGSAKDAAESLLGWKRAPLARHVADVASAVMLIVILFVAIAVAAPAQQAVTAACTTGKEGLVSDTCQGKAETVLALNQLSFLLNVGMFVCDVTKYRAKAPVDHDKRE